MNASLASLGLETRWYPRWPRKGFLLCKDMYCIYIVSKLLSNCYTIWEKHNTYITVRVYLEHLRNGNFIENEKNPLITHYSI